MLSFIVFALNDAVFAQDRPATQPVHAPAASQEKEVRPAFTNLAGKVIHLHPQEMTDTHVRFGDRNIRLDVFPEHEQRRIRLILGTCVLPVELEEKRDFYSNTLERLAVLEKGELVSRDDATARRQKILSAWHKALVADTTLLPAERLFWSQPQRPLPKSVEEGK